MRRISKSLLPALAAALTVAGCGSSYSGGSPSTTTTRSSSPSTGATGVVRSARNAALGATVLTDARGITLYHLGGEQGGRFICTGSCLQLWRPVTASASATQNAGIASLGTVKRPEGLVQVSYRGMPLYTFLQDRRPGDAKGQGLKDVGTWSAVSIAHGSAPAKTSAAPPHSGY
jgi:predicted lipoprotein with Yx(FWY)xxD motif